MHSLDDDFVAGLETFYYFPQRAETLAHLDRTHACLVRLIDNHNYLVALQLRYGFLRDDKRSLLGFDDRAHFPELAGSQEIPGFGKVISILMEPVFASRCRSCA